MRNFLITTGILLLLSLVITSCEDQNLKTDNKESIDDITENIKFLDLEQNPMYKKHKDTKGFNIIRIVLWEKHYNNPENPEEYDCYGWGVCEAYILVWQVYKNTKDDYDNNGRNIVAPVIQESDNKYLYLYIENDVSDVPTDYLTLSLSDNRKASNDSITINIPAGDYIYNSSLGEFGGYKIPINYEEL